MAGLAPVGADNGAIRVSRMSKLRLSLVFAAVMTVVLIQNAAVANYFGEHRHYFIIEDSKRSIVALSIFYLLVFAFMYCVYFFAIRADKLIFYDPHSTFFGNSLRVSTVSLGNAALNSGLAAYDQYIFSHPIELLVIAAVFVLSFIVTSTTCVVAIGMSKIFDWRPFKPASSARKNTGSGGPG